MTSGSEILILLCERETNCWVTLIEIRDLMILASIGTTKVCRKVRKLYEFGMLEMKIDKINRNSRNQARKLYRVKED